MYRSARTEKQHVELARDIAQKFNNDFAPQITSHGFGDAFFPLPEPLIQGPATRVMSLARRQQEDVEVGSCPISRASLSPTMPTPSRMKIRRAKTDPDPLPHEEKALEARPEADNLVGIYAALSGKTRADVLKEFGGAQFSIFKPALADLLVAKLSPITAEMRRLKDDVSYIDSVLADGSDRARAIAAETMKAVKDIVGFVRR